MALEKFEDQLRDLAVLYGRTKALILKAEEFDPESKSNISVFKEQRDALDHIMRSVAAVLDPAQAKNEEYVRKQFDKATSHLYRAAYDSLDGIAVSCRLIMSESMVGVSPQAITSVFPEYWDLINEFHGIQEKITEQRHKKDIGDETHGNLLEYCVLAERACKVVEDIRSKRPALHEWETRNQVTQTNNSRHTMRWALKSKAWEYAIFTVIGGILLIMIQKLVFSAPAKTAGGNAETGSTTNQVRK